MKRWGHICLFYFRFSSASVSPFFLCIAGAFQAYSKLFSNELEHLAWWDLCSNCYFPPAGSGLSGFDTMRKAHIFHDLCIAKAHVSMLADAELRHPPLSSRLLPLPTKPCPQGDISLSPPNFRRAEPVSVLACDYMCNFPIWPTRQRDGNSLCLTPRRCNTCTRYTVQMSISRATTSVWHSNAASAAARWVHLSQLRDHY